MLFFIAHEQKERSIPCPCSEGSVALGSEMLRGVYTKRSECAQHDSAVTHTDSWINLLICINGHWAALAPHNPTNLNFYPQHTYIINETSNALVEVLRQADTVYSRGDPCGHTMAPRYVW